MSINDSYMFASNDARLVLDLLTLLTYAHFILPARFPFLVAIDLVILTLYCASIFVCGGQGGSDRIVENIIYLSVSMLGYLWGKRSLEILERATFTQIAQERTLRYEAEFQLSSQSQSNERRRDPDATSIGASLFTAEMFDLRVEGNIHAQLEGIKECGAKEHWIIEPEDLRPVDDGYISNGGFGMVLLAYYHGVEVAVKVPRPSDDTSASKTLQSLVTELRIFRRLHHPHIVAFHGACIDLASANIALVLEFVRGVPLRTACSGLPSTSMALSQRLLWADNICAALVYLHAQEPSIIHSDIKDTNVLVESGGDKRTAKLLDFGLSKLITGQHLSVGGTLRWMAPEAILRKKNAVTTKLDVFSFGRLFYKIATGRAPLEGMTSSEIKALARGGSNPPLQWPSSMLLLQECVSLCDACLLWDVFSRPNMIDVHMRLRALASQDDVPDNLRDALRESLAHRLSSENLLSVFADIRRDSSIAQGCGQPVSREFGHDAFVETPLRSRILCIRSTIGKWNFIKNSCCTLHAGLRAVADVVDGLRATECRDVPCIHNWQCQTCGLLGDGECNLCNGLDPDLVSVHEQQAHLVTNDEEPAVEQAGTDNLEQRRQPPGQTLLYDAFAETSLRTRAVSVILASLRWSIPRDESSCCTMHARMRAVERVLEAMGTSTCANSQILYDWQCQACGSLGNGQCVMCSRVSQYSEPGEHSQAASIEAALRDNDGEDLILPTQL
eukprot:TRINITY_DN9111_c1_g1_i3.p1 TRINITY_DN9111_c1_g1~~TRINITY_DN9111_c1_g1_i3.p1  ORF type:complete len:729 (-),score=58.24 TRINITY_DN9111_c1_g1_i3:207-2393(-)